MDGKTYLIRPLTLGDFGACEFHLLSETRDVGSILKHAAKRVSTTRSAAVLIEHMERVAEEEWKRGAARQSTEQVLRFLYTPTGVHFSAWLCLRKEQAGQFPNLETVADLFDRATAPECREFIRRRDLVSCLDVSAEKDWPYKAVETRQSRGGKTRGHSWRRWVRETLTDCYPAWTIPDLANLTIYQARLARAGNTQLGGIARMSLADAQEAVRQLRGG